MHDRVVAFLEYMLTTLDGCASILVDEAEKAFNEVKLNGNEVASFFLRFEEAAAVLKYIAGRWGLTRRSIKDESSLVETCIERFEAERQVNPVPWGSEKHHGQWCVP